MQDMNWDDLRYLIALYRQGSFAAASRELGQDETTIALEGIDPAHYSDSQILGQYILMLTQRIESAETVRERRIAEQALQLGFALLQGEEVLV